MTKHTPAPWVGDKHGYVWAEGGQMPICTIRGWGYLTGAGAKYLSQEEAIAIQDANMRLICAAPEMLEALKAWRAVEDLRNEINDLRHPRTNLDRLEAQRLRDKFATLDIEILFIILMIFIAGEITGYVLHAWLKGH